MMLEGDRYWPDFCRLIERPDLLADARFRDLQTRRVNSAACIAELDGEFAGRDFAAWKALLARIDAPWAPVQTVAEVIADPQVEANATSAKCWSTGSPSTAYRPCRSSSTNNRRLSIERPSSENTLRKCSKSSATAGTRLPDSKTPALLPEAWPMQRNQRGAS